jgi:hypothetical protein
MHAVEFHRRELLAMRLILDKTPPGAHAEDAESELPQDLFVAIVAAASEAHHVVPEHLQRMPWFAIVVRFLAKRLGDGDDADHVSELLCSNALLVAMPAGVRARTFGQLIDNLALRIRPPVAFEPSVGRAEQLLDPIRTAMTTDDNESLMKIADEFIALAVRAYDTVANELRWLVVPRRPAPLSVPASDERLVQLHVRSAVAVAQGRANVCVCARRGQCASHRAVDTRSTVCAAV